MRTVHELMRPPERIFPPDEPPGYNFRGRPEEEPITYEINAYKKLHGYHRHPGPNHPTPKKLVGEHDPQRMIPTEDLRVGGRSVPATCAKSLFTRSMRSPGEDRRGCP